MATNEAPEQPEQPADMESMPPEPQSGGTQSSGGVFGIPTKLLIIGGGAGGAVLAIVIVVALLFVTGIIAGGNPQPMSILDLAPDDADTIVVVDFQRVLDNDLLAEEFDAVEEIERFEDTLGIDPEDLSALLVLTRDGLDTVVMQGTFDLEDIRDELEDADVEFDEDSYRGYEVWDNDAGSLVAIFDEYLVIGDEDQVESVLKNLYNETRTLERADEDNEMKQILDKVGAGFLVYAATGDACSAVDNCDGYGWALTEVDESDEEAVVEIALLFSSERRAERAADDYDQVADFLERVDELNIDDTEADGNFVVGQAIQDLAEEESATPSAPAPPVAQRAQAQPATSAEPAAQFAQPAAAVATATPAATPVGNESVGRSEWVEDCSVTSAEQANQFLARHEQMTRDDADEYCKCLYDYIEEWEGPPPATMSDLMANPLAMGVADSMSFMDLLTDAQSYCV